MQLVALGWQAYGLTSSATSLGILAIVRFAPMLLLFGPSGLVADKFDRRNVMLVSQAVMLSTALCLGILTLFGTVNIWLIYLLVGAAAIASTFDTPVRQCLLAQL